MAFVYLDREFDGNNSPTKFYRISIDKKRKFSQPGHHSRLVPFHSVRVSESQAIKTRLLKEFNRYRIEDKTKVRDRLELSTEQRDEVQMAMDSYKERQSELSYRSSSSSSSDLDMEGCLAPLGIFFGIIFMFILIANPPNITTSQKYEDNTSVKYTGIVDSRLLNDTYKNVNVRSAPNEQSKVVKTLSNGTRIFFSETSNGWVYVVLDDGREGWVASNLIIKDQKEKSD
jgi:hypothetical protein